MKKVLCLFAHPNVQRSRVNRRIMARPNDKTRFSLAQQARVDIERMFAEEDRRIQHGDEGWSEYVEGGS